MSTKAFNIKSGRINLKPKGSTPSNIRKGDFFVDLTTGLLKINNGSNTDELVTINATQTLENKTFTTPNLLNIIGLTKSDVGLGNVDNTSDLNKPISTAEQTALNNKQSLATILTQISILSPINDSVLQQDGGVMSSTTLPTFKTELAITKADVGLGNVDNTSDANQNAAVATLTNKTILTPLIDNYIELTEETSVSAPSVGKLRLYAKNDGTLNIVDSNNIEKTIQSFNDPIIVSFNQSQDYSQSYLQGTSTNQVFIQPKSQTNWVNPQFSLSPDILPTGDGRAIAWSPNGEFLAVGHVTSPFITIYQKNGTALTKLTNPATLPTGQVNGVAWSPDGQFLSCSHAVSPFITIYQRSGTTFTKLTNPATLPTGTGDGNNWSSNGEFLAVAHTTSPFITIYQRSGTTFTKLTNPATLPTGNGNFCSWSPNIEFLAVAHDTTPFITIYQRSGTTFTKLTNPATLPANNSNSCEWSPDGQFLAIGHASTPFITIYQRSGTTFTKLTNPATLPTNEVNSVSWSPNGKFLATGHTTTPFVTIYERSGTTFTKLTNPSNLVNNTVNGVSWSLNGEFLSCAFSNNSPYIRNYQTNENMPSIGLLKLTRKEKSF